MARTTNKSDRAARGRRLALLLAAGLLAGCAARRSPVEAFYENDYAFAAKRFEDLAARKDKNFALYSCNLGEARLAQGDFMDTKEALLDATMVMHNLGEGELRGLGSLIGPENVKAFKGDPFEKAMVDAVNGIVNYAMGDYETAAVGFRRALLADKDSAKEYQDDFGLAHFMLGKALLRMGDVEMAKVGFRNAQKCAPHNPYVSLNASRSANLTLIIDLGRAPVKEPSGPSGSMDVYRRARYPEAYAVVRVDGQEVGKSAQIVDLFEQAKHSGRSAKDAIQAAKGVTKMGAAGVASFSDDDRVRLIALLIALFLPAEADIRQCELLPGEVHVLQAKVKPGLHTLTLAFHNAAGHVLSRYTQHMYYIHVEDGRETFLYCRAIPYRDRARRVVVRTKKKDGDK